MMKSVDRELGTIDLAKIIQEMPKKEIAVEEPPEDKKEAPQKKQPGKKETAKRGSVKTTSKKEKADKKAPLLVPDKPE